MRILADADLILEFFLEREHEEDAVQLLEIVSQESWLVLTVVYH